MIIAMRESTTRKRASGWSFTGTTYMASDGVNGSYAEAATSAAASVFMPGSTLGAATFACWIREDSLATNTFLVAPSSTASQIRLLTSSAGGGLVRAQNDNGVTASKTSASGLFGASTWTLVAFTTTHGASDVIEIHVANSTKGTATDATPDTYTSTGGFRLLNNAAADDGPAADMRSPAVWSRVLSDAEIAALHTLGPTHDLRVASGDYLGSPAHWWPGDGDSGTTVTDRGSVGGCNLTLNGGVTLEAA